MEVGEEIKSITIKFKRIPEGMPKNTKEALLSTLSDVERWRTNYREVLHDRFMSPGDKKAVRKAMRDNIKTSMEYAFNIISRYAELPDVDYEIKYEEDQK